MQHIYTFKMIVYNGAQKSVLTLAHTQINKGGLLTNPLLVAIPYTFIYNTILQLNIVKNNIISNNNYVLIGNDNTHTHYEETIPSGQEQTYETV